MLSLTLEYHVYPVALRYWIELWSITMNWKELGYTSLESYRWHWMMDWCKTNRINPSDTWDLAKEAYALAH